MNLAIVGSGYVGLVTGACFAAVGHRVICVDNDLKKVHQLQDGHIPIYEPGLEELVKKNVASGHLSFTASIGDAVEASKVIFIAVPTPPQPDGSVDLSFVEGVAREIAVHIKEYRIVVDKSTVPVKTGEKVAQTISRYNPDAPIDVVSNPEFLREGSAVEDLMKPDRIVIGVSSERAVAPMREIYEPFNAPIMITDLNSAELIKHASNSFLALKISYINAVAAICEASGANVEQVADGMGADKRIGRPFLNAGIGYGGSCFPKDLSAFIRISDRARLRLPPAQGSGAHQPGPEGALHEENPRVALGPAPQENRRPRPRLQGQHRRRPQQCRHRRRPATHRGGRRSPRLRSQGHGESRIPRSRLPDGQDGRGSRAGRRRTPPPHRVE